MLNLLTPVIYSQKLVESYKQNGLDTSPLVSQQRFVSRVQSGEKMTSSQVGFEYL